jgi:hypothetical protein
VTSGDISANLIVQYLSGSPTGTVALIDYLQILDQQRSKPPLSEQMRVLSGFARKSGVILGFISQIDRSFDPKRDPLPSLDDVRLPNPIPAGIFSKACFLHAGETRTIAHLSIAPEWTRHCSFHDLSASVHRPIR